MSTRYRDPTTLVHNPQRASSTRRGTTRYASINNHKGLQLSRRDDLESIAYILIRFLKGTLPWENLPKQLSREKGEKAHHRVRDIKINTPIAELCADLPEVFGAFLEYVRGLKFAEMPDIPQWKARFRALYEQNGYHLEVSATNKNNYISSSSISLPAVIVLDYALLCALLCFIAFY